MRHEILITPLDSRFGGEPGPALHWHQDTFVASSEPAIYCTDPDLSWFRMKSTDSSPFLESTFYGLRGGDLVTVRLEALVGSGTSSLAVDVFKVKPGYETELSVTNELPVDALDTYFREYAMPCLLQLGTDDIGVTLRLRPTGPQSEVVVRNVTVEIHTANHKFAPETQIVRYEGVGDYLDCIRTYSLTDADVSYNTLHQSLTAGHIEFPDNGTVSFASGMQGFRGLMAMLPGSRYRAPISLYCEYLQPDGDGPKVQVRGVDAFNAPISSTSHSLCSTSEWTRTAVHFTGDSLDGARKLIVSIGTNEPVNLQLRNIRIAVVRHDDEVKRAPNRLEDLFADLGRRLRNLAE